LHRHVEPDADHDGGPGDHFGEDPGSLSPVHAEQQIVRPLQRGRDAAQLGDGPAQCDAG